VPEVQKDGVMNQINNPEVEVDVTKANTMFTRQIVQLRLITNRLQNAYLGEDVDWIDTGEQGVKVKV
jgi:glypican 6